MDKVHKQLNFNNLARTVAERYTRVYHSPFSGRRQLLLMFSVFHHSCVRSTSFVRPISAHLCARFLLIRAPDFCFFGSQVSAHSEARFLLICAPNFCSFVRLISAHSCAQFLFICAADFCSFVRPISVHSCARFPLICEADFCSFVRPISAHLCARILLICAPAHSDTRGLC